MHFEKAPQVISVLMPEEFKKQFLEVSYSFQDIVKHKALSRFYNNLTGKLIIN